MSGAVGGLKNECSSGNGMQPTVQQSRALQERYSLAALCYLLFECCTSCSSSAL